MSQHLIDTGQRVSTEQEDARRDALHEARREGDGAQRHSFDGNGHGTGSGQGRGPDSTLRALDALADALSVIGDDRQLLEKRLRDLHRQRSEGREWKEILSEEEAPGTMQLVSHMLACLAKASGTLRKELVDNLRREGVSIPAIAKLFGVTHQRVSNLLRRPVD